MGLAGGTLIAGSARASAAVPAAADRSSLEAELRALLDTFTRAFDSRDLAQFVAQYSDDPETTYVFDGRVIVGKAAIVEEYRSTFFDAASANDRLALELVRARRLEGLLVATVRGRVTDGDGRLKFRGVSSLILRRDGPGWRVIYDHAS